MEKKRKGKILLIVSFVLLSTSWALNQFIWRGIGWITPLVYKWLLAYQEEVYLSFNISLIAVEFLIGYIGARLYFEENK